MTDLSPLIEKIEAAEEGSRELDVEIAKHLGGAIRWSTTVGTRYQVLWPEAEFSQGDDINELPDVPFYTTSIDAIVGLIEREFPGGGWAVNEEVNGAWAKVQPFTQGPTYKAVTLSSQPALALCAAFLRAVQAKRKV